MGERVAAVEGFDLPPFASMTNIPVWNENGPPKRTLYNYPTRATHDATQFISGYPAPHDIGVRIYQRGTTTNMVARLLKGQPMKEVLSWAQNEREGFMR